MSLSGADVEAFVASVRERTGGIDSARAVELRIVEPFLEHLGWDVRGPSVTPQAEIGGHRVSYLLSIEEVPTIAVQTAAPGGDLDAEHVPAVADLLEHSAIDWAVVTDGQRYVLVANADGEMHRQRHRLEALPDAVTALRHYTRDAAVHRVERTASARVTSLHRLAADRAAAVDAVTESLVSIAGEPIAEDARSAAEAILDDLLESLPEDSAAPDVAAGTDSAREASDQRATDEHEPSGRPAVGDDGPADEADSTADGVDSTADGRDSAADGRNPVGDERRDSTAGAAARGHRSGSVSDRSSESLQSRSSSSADSEATSNSGQPTAAGATSTSGAGDEPDPDSTDVARPPTAADEGEYVVRFFGGNASVGAVGTDNPAGTLVGAVQFLLENKALANAVTLPWGVQTDRAVLAAAPEHPDGSPMAAYESIEDRWYVWTGGSEERIRTAVEELADVVGLRVMFQGDW